MSFLSTAAFSGPQLYILNENNNTEADDTVSTVDLDVIGATSRAARNVHTKEAGGKMFLDPDGNRIYIAHESTDDMEVSLDGETLYLIDDNLELRHYQTGTLELLDITQYSTTGILTGVDLALNDRYFFITLDSSLVIVDQLTQEETHIIDVCTLGCGDMLPSPENNDTLYLLDGNNNANRLLILELSLSEITCTNHSTGEVIRKTVEGSTPFLINSFF